MQTATGSAVAAGAIVACLVDMLATKGILSQQDVGLLLLSPRARGLFARAIQQSGTAGFGLPPRSLADNEKLGEALAELAGVAHNESQIEALLDPARYTGLCRQFAERGAAMGREIAAGIMARSLSE